MSMLWITLDGRGGFELGLDVRGGDLGGKQLSILKEEIRWLRRVAHDEGGLEGARKGRGAYIHAGRRHGHR